MSWEVAFEHGPAEELFAATDTALLEAFPQSRIIRILTVSRPTIVLGSAQTSDVLVSVPEGVSVVRRKSGGGAVWLDPDAMVWFDVIIGPEDPLWVPDVGRSMWWLGDLFASVIEATGVSTETVAVHRSAMVRHELDRLVCWMGLGAGEVTMGPGGPKAVGIAQKRVRTGALFQVGVLLAPSQYRLASVVGIDAQLVRMGEGPIPTTSDVLTSAALDLFEGLPRPRKDLA
jgi:lipoate-protein ligase A